LFWEAELEVERVRPFAESAISTQCDLVLK
jgi:hypothetical protein